jgi:hypothetical protein
MLKKLLRRFFFIILILVLLVIILAGAVKFVAGPVIIRQQFQMYLSKFWAGKVHIEQAEFNLFKPLKYKNVSFLDPSGRQWAHAETFEVTIQDWPSLEVKIEAIKLDSLKLLKELFNTAPEETDEVNKELTLPAATIDDLSVYLTDGNEPTLILGDLSFSSKQNENSYNFTLISKDPNEEEKFEAVGAINLESLQTDVSVELEHTVRQADRSLLTTVFSGTEDYDGAGHAAANLKISGSVNEPKSLLPKGNIGLTDWSLSYKELESVVKGINCNIVLAENTVGSEKFTAFVYDGKTEGNFKIDYSSAGPVEISGNFKVKEMQLAEVAKDFERLGKLGKGTADAEFVFSSKRAEPNSLNGHGYIELNDSDLYSTPVASYMFTTIGLKDQHLTRMADGVCVFSINGSVITINEAKATSDYGAIVVEPGGTIDLEKNWVDVYVIAVPVRVFRELLNKIPFMSIITNPTDKLTRFRVEGNLSEPPNKLVKKQPFRDIAAGTVSFFKEVINAGGRLTDTTVNSSRGLFETLTRNNGAK